MRCPTAVALEQLLKLLSAPGCIHREYILLHAKIPLLHASCAPSQQ